MTNRFRDKTLRKEYDAAVTAFRTKHANLFFQGSRRAANGVSAGSSFAEWFWRGFDGKPMGAGFDAAAKKTLAYAYYRAGQDCAKESK